MSLFEVEGGRLVPAQFGRDVPGGITEPIWDAICNQVLQVIGRPLFPVTWRELSPTQMVRQPSGEYRAQKVPRAYDTAGQLVARLTALDAVGQVVSVAVARTLTSEILIESLSALADTAALPWADLAQEYPRGAGAFRKEWAEFRDSLPTQVPGEPRLVFATAQVAREVRPALDVLATSGVEVHQLVLRQMSNGRLFVEVGAVTPRFYGKNLDLLLMRGQAAIALTRDAAGEAMFAAPTVRRSSPISTAIPRVNAADLKSGSTFAPHAVSATAFSAAATSPAAASFAATVTSTASSSPAGLRSGLAPRRDAAASSHSLSGTSSDSTSLGSRSASVDSGSVGARRASVGGASVGSASVSPRSASLGARNNAIPTRASLRSERATMGSPLSPPYMGSVSRRQTRGERESFPSPYAPPTLKAPYSSSATSSFRTFTSTVSANSSSSANAGNNSGTGANVGNNSGTAISANTSANASAKPSWAKLPSPAVLSAASPANIPVALGGYRSRRTQSERDKPADRADGQPVSQINLDEAGLSALAQRLQGDTRLVLVTNWGSEITAQLTRDGYIRLAEGDFTDPTRALLALGMPTQDAWQKWHLGDRHGPTLAESVAELNAAIQRGKN